MSPQSTQKKFKNPRAKYNFQGRTCSITGVGSYVPARVMTNAELEKMVDTSDDWITSRTVGKARFKAEQIRLLVVAMLLPAVAPRAAACVLQQPVGAQRHAG